MFINTKYSMGVMKNPLENLTKETTGRWTSEDWLRWYENNKEEPIYADFRIRDTRKTDLPAIKSLVARTNLECEPETATRGIVAVKDRRIVGYQEIERFYTHDVDFLRVLVVHQRYRRQGIGGSIISHAISDGGRYQCNIHSDNVASLNLFRKLGFREGNSVNGLVQLSYGFSGLCPGP